MPSNPLLDMLSGHGGFDQTKVRARLLQRFGNENGFADWLYDLAENPDTSSATKAKCADIILEIFDPGKSSNTDYNTIADDELKRYVDRILGGIAGTGLGKSPEPKTKEVDGG